MAYRIERTIANDYRCTCCHSEYTTSWLVDDVTSALAEIPTSFPVEGKPALVVIMDETTGKRVAESRVDYPPARPRENAYKYTAWTRWVDEDAFPGRGENTTQVIRGVHREAECISIWPAEPEPTPLDFVTDRTWSDILDELAARR